MTEHNSAIGSPPAPLSAEPLIEDRQKGRSSVGATGLLFGFLGVLAFSFTLPFTHLAVSTLNPLLVGAGRAVVAALCAVVLLAIVRSHRPRGRQWLRLIVVAAGVVAGFPLLTSFALQSAPPTHGAVVIGMLPVTTALIVVIRTGERPSKGFWIASAAGLVAAIAFVWLSDGGLGDLKPSDLLLFAAVLCAAFGYAEGGMLARELGSWQTICWALIVALPAMVPLTIAGMVAEPVTAGPGGWLAFAYVSLISMFLGFFAWYRGLAIGPMARVSQVQLLQPVMTIAWSALFFGDLLTWQVLAGGTAVVVCAAAAVRARIWH